MVGDIIANRRSFLKNGDYQTPHELLCAKLHQARTVAEVASEGSLTDNQLLHLVWCMADLLTEACDQCDRLTAQDFEPVK